MSSERKPGRTLSADEWASLDSDATRSIERTPDRPAPPRRTNGAMTFLRLAALALLALFTYAMSMIPANERNAIGSTFAPLFFVVAPTLYFLPTIEAALRKHRSLTSIGLVNLFLGWTLVGWVAAIAWACAGGGKTTTQAGASGVPASKQPPVATMSPVQTVAEGEKACPYCAETIKAAAIRCRYCQADLPPMEPSEPITPDEPTVEPPASPPDPLPRPALAEKSSSFTPQILGGIAIGGILLFAWAMQQDGKPISRTTAASRGEVQYTGKLRIDAGTEYLALEVPSRIGGACDGWGAVEIREPGATSGMRGQLCWKRDGGMIHVTTKSGTEITPSHYSVWRD